MNFTDGYYFLFLILLAVIRGNCDEITADFSYPLLTWSHITVKFKKRIILDINNVGNINAGRLLGVLGPSGSGKSTFLNIIGGKIISGRAVKIVHDINSQSGTDGRLRKFPFPHNDVAIVYQQDSFFPMMTVEETLYMAAAMRILFPNENNDILKVNSTYLRDTITSIMHVLSLAQVANSPVGEPTSGDNQGDSPLATRGIYNC
jgi:ABC-type multidrug transport system ATPase subunit